jgi:chromosome segregation ATPase
MSFNTNRNHNSNDHGSFWTSYSDLFLGMSVIFLLLYVTTSLRTGTDGMRSEIENKKLTQKVQDLQNQIKAYDSIKKDYLSQEASPKETQQYNELMDKLSLLKEEAKDEKNRLSKEAVENEKKEQALNQYQQMVRNIINANVAAKTKIKTREVVIGDQDTEIAGQSKEITDLKSEVDMKQKQIAKDENKVQTLASQLETELKNYKQALKQHKMSQASYEKKTQALKSESQKQLSALQNRIMAAQTDVDKKAQELEQTRQALAATESEKQALSGKANQLEGQAKALAGQLGSTEAKYKQTLAEKNAEAAGKAAAEGRANQLGAKVSSLGSQLQQTKAEKNAEAAGKAAAEGRANQLGAKVSSLGSQLKNTQGRLRGKEGQLKDTEGLLAKAQAEADARKAIARDIQAGFKKAGIQADVDSRTGEVVLNFGKVYFDVGSAQLKNQMKDILQKAMPVYSKSLLDNPKVAGKINAVEIIGFASPTYKGKYVDPKNLPPGSRAAINYNLDLSYQRARSIFQYVFDEKNIQFKHQDDLLPLIKVTGRSFLAEKTRAPAAKGTEFCSSHSCNEAQRVIIRFSFDDKK